MKEKAVNFRAIFYTFIAFMLGIIVAKRFFDGNVGFIIVSLVVLALACGYLIFHKSYKASIFILIFFLLGNGFYFIGETSFNAKTYHGKVAVIGRVTDDIQNYGFSTQVVLDEVVINGKSADKLRLIIENSHADIEVGSKVAFETEVQKSKIYNLGEFNSKDYRSGVRYSASANYDNIVFTEGRVKVDETIRLKVKQRIYENMSSGNASIAYAVMFGDKSDLDGEIYTSYQKSGIIHVLTVSGLHVGFLVSLFYWTMRKCGVNNIVNLVISTIVLLFYAYLCAFSPSVVRAGIMAFCMMFSRAINRKYDSLNALGLAGFVLCLTKPLTALDIGFLMSFFCVFAIIMINPALTKFFSVFFPEKIASLIALSTSAQIGILPFIAYMGGTINLISFAVNIIVVPIFSLAYPILFLVSMLSTFMPFLGTLLWVIDKALKFVGMCATFFGHAGLTIPLSPMGFGVIIAFFITLFLLSRYFMLKAVKKFSCFTASFLVLVFAFCFYAIPVNLEKTTSISYLNSYGQMSVVFTSKSGQTAVVGNNLLLGKYQKRQYKKDLETYFSFRQLSNEEVANLCDYGVERFFTSGGNNDADDLNCQVAPVNESHQIGEITFEYLSYSDNEEVAGILIKLDNHKIFVASENNLSYNKYEHILGLHQPELVFAGKDSVLSQNDDYTCITHDYLEGSEYSFQTHGNLKLTYNGKTWKGRGLD